MATHTMHADVHENGLADDCPRCEELAKAPLELDAVAFLSAWRLMLDVEFSRENGSHYRSAAEATLCKEHLYLYALFLERYTPIDPREVIEQYVGGPR